MKSGPPRLSGSDYQQFGGPEAAPGKHPCTRKSGVPEFLTAIIQPSSMKSFGTPLWKAPEAEQWKWGFLFHAQL